MSDIDPESKSGTCANCGRVSVKRKMVKGKPTWRCRKQIYEAEVRRLRRRGVKERQVPGPGIRRKQVYRSYKKEACERCGFEGDPCQLDVHHMDSNRSNNAPENLRTLCSNCHRLYTFKRLPEAA